MLDVKAADREVTMRFRPYTFPVTIAIRMLKAGERAQRPARSRKPLAMEPAAWR